MNNIITQKIKDVLKNKIFSVFSQKIYEMIEITIESFNFSTPKERYLSLISNLQTSIKDIVKSTLVTLFETIDNEYKHQLTDFYTITLTNLL